MSTLDDKDINRFDSANGGFTAEVGDTFNLVYNFDFGSKFYEEGRTFCMYNEPGSNSKWASEGC